MYLKKPERMFMQHTIMNPIEKKSVCFLLLL